MSRQAFGSCAYMPAEKKNTGVVAHQMIQILYASANAGAGRQVALSQVWIGAKPCPIGSSSPPLRRCRTKKNLAWRRTGVVVGLPRHARAQSTCASYQHYLEQNKNKHGKAPPVQCRLSDFNALHGSRCCLTLRGL